MGRMHESARAQRSRTNTHRTVSNEKRYAQPNNIRTSCVSYRVTAKFYMKTGWKIENAAKRISSFARSSHSWMMMYMFRLDGATTTTTTTTPTRKVFVC